MGRRAATHCPGAPLSSLGWLGDEAYVTYAACSHYCQHSHHCPVRHAIIRAQIDAAASASLRERLETGRELVVGQTSIVHVDRSRAVDRDGQPALRLERTRLRLRQRDIDAAL